ncbi:MAG TPA: hypothetical protein VFB58_09905 [Chloroflexota bacterium]|nr:hypothetical protein [Chloroflexota bacterium]
MSNLWRVFLLAFVVFGYFMPQWADWNIDSRLDMTEAIVNHGTIRIDAYNQNTWDKAVDHGHFYSDKAPGTAVLGVPILAAFKAAHHVPFLSSAIAGVERNGAWNVPIALGRSATQKQPAKKGTVLGGCQRKGAGNVQYIPWGNRLVPPMRDWALSKYLVTVGVVGLISALFAVFFFWFLGLFAIAGAARWLSTVVYAFGSVALPYSSNFYSHQLVAAFLFVAFALVFLAARSRRLWQAASAGFLLGFSIFTEYTVALVVVVIGLYLLWSLRSQLRAIGAAVATGLVPIIALLGYNQMAWGNPLDTGYSHDFCWSAAQSAGFAGFTYPHLWPLIDLTFGEYRGLFFTSPFLLLALPGAYLMWRRGRQAEALTCIASAVILILAISAQWGWNGGRVDGPRYIVACVPFLALPAAFAVRAMFRSAAWRVVLGIIAAWSLAATWILFLGGATFPTSWLPYPLTQYSLPALAHNQITPNFGLFFGLSGWESLLPLAVAVVLIALIPPRRREAPSQRPVTAQAVPSGRYTD